jgi:hypothetical protein
MRFSFYAAMLQGFLHSRPQWGIPSSSALFFLRRVWLFLGEGLARKSQFCHVMLICNNELVSRGAQPIDGEKQWQVLHGLPPKDSGLRYTAGTLEAAYTLLEESFTPIL